MRILRRTLTAIMLASCTASSVTFAQWQKLPPIPQPNAGFALGAAGGGIMVIGGTNWQDGVKNWLSVINRFDPEAMQWSSAGTLDDPLAYAVCDSYPINGKLIIAGGSNGKRPTGAILTVDKNSFKREVAPALPQHLVLSAGGIIGDTLIVVGGTNDATNIAGFTRKVYAWNLKSKTLAVLPDYPGEAVGMAAAVALGGELFVFGGAHPLRGITNSAEAYAFTLDTKQWRRLKACPIAARGSAAIALDERRIYLAGGYGGTPEGFLTSAFIYDTQRDSYASAPPIPYAATASLTKVNGFVYCLGGEDAPKSRTDAFWRIRIEDLMK